MAFSYRYTVTYGGYLDRVPLILKSQVCTGVVFALINKTSVKLNHEFKLITDH